MPSCSHCGKRVILTYRCHYCGEQFCEEHRLPERHQCIGIEDAKQQARVGKRYVRGGRIEEIDAWLSSDSSERFYLEGHAFEKMLSGEIRIDGGKFSRTEARDIGELLASSNPFAKFNATLAIWGENGTIYIGLLIAAVLLLSVVVIILKA
jgi:hypothetical protein